jgi:GT2 family glycosyltransferase
MNFVTVINTYKRPAELAFRSLNASLHQKIPPKKIILIDQNIEGLNLPEDILANQLIVRTRTNKKSVSAARNTLVIPEGAEWIFFCDDDGYPCDDYSEKLEKIISKNPSLEILAGSIVRDDNKQFYTLRHKKGGSLKSFRNTKNLMGSNFVIKAKVFDELERFDENFGAGSRWGSSEETDFCWKAYFAGKNMEFFPELIVYHVPPFTESLDEGFHKAFKYGVGKGALVSKWLFKKKRIKVLYELLEMITVPFIQSIRGLLTFKFGLIAANFAALTGRLYGMIKYIFTAK